MTDTNVPAKPSGPWLTDKTYALLKFITQIVLPAFGTLYAAVAGLWGLPASEQVVGTVLAIDTFLGVVLGISSAQFNAARANSPLDGTLTVTRFDDNSGQVEVGLHGHPAELAAKKEVVLRVSPVQAASTTPGDVPPVPPTV